MAIATKVKKEEVVELVSDDTRSEVLVDGLPNVKQIIRYISKQYANPMEGHYSVGEVDLYVSSWIDKGYKLFDTHYIGEVPEGYGVLYILVRQ